MNRRACLRAAALLPAAAIPLGCAAPGGREARPSAPRALEELPARAVRRFVDENRGCGEAVLMAVCEAIGFPGGPYLDMALGLSGGVGLQGKTCGCVSAGAMGLSLAVAGRERAAAARKPRVYDAAGTFVKSFEKECGSTECRKLCGLDLATPEGFERFKKEVKGAVCAKVMEKACRILAEMLPRV